MEGNGNILKRRQDRRSERILIPRIQDELKQRRTGAYEALGKKSNGGIRKSVEYGRAKVRRELEWQHEAF